MAPAPKLDYDSTLKRVKTNINERFKTYQNHVLGQQVFRTAMQFVQYWDSKDVDVLKEYLANPTDNIDTAIEMYNTANKVIELGFRSESERRKNVLMIRAMATQRGTDINWNDIPFANVSISSIQHDGVFKLAPIINISDPESPTIQPETRLKEALQSNPLIHVLNQQVCHTRSWQMTKLD